ncbi:MAG TPA: tryptophan 2,3-dioxygenase [Chitinophagaceae bacterium]|nr:tryptophan 2,3-dioxygenase [Chitinophagaceae bacterium]HCY89430.1 tryptophan 2,3-dioxygenase [Chitinophagaceae bacterium]
MAYRPVYYGEYLQLEKILEAQSPVSDEPGNEHAHDEMLFIVIHQAYELWFKQILFEVNSVVEIMNKPSINDNSADLQAIVHRLRRVVTIMRVLVQQIDILETMTPMDFLEFRDMLRPASGFQSWQFKILEARLGLQFDERHGQQYYVSQLNQKEIDLIRDAEKMPSVMNLLNQWLERMPFLDAQAFWGQDQGGHADTHPFWAEYEKRYSDSLAEAEKSNLQAFRQIFYGAEPQAHRRLSPQACRSALFIMLYRGYPMLELPFQLLEVMLEIDNQLGSWRYRHINMVRRMIGSRIGTGGSTGAGYLQGAMDKHYIFREIAQLNSFLLDRRRLPALPSSLTGKLGFQF